MPNLVPFWEWYLLDCRVPHLWYSLPNPVATDKNKLYYGDNLEVLKRNVKDE